MFEDAEVDAEGRLVVRCDDAPETAADLAQPGCLAAVLHHLWGETSVRGVVLVHDREKAYGTRAMAVLDGLLALARLLDQFAERTPAPTFPGFTAKEAEAVCATCEFRPATLYARLRQALLQDPSAFPEPLGEVCTALAAYEEEGCRGCAGATVQDLRVLVGEMRKLAGA